MRKRDHGVVSGGHPHSAVIAVATQPGQRFGMQLFTQELSFVHSHPAEVSKVGVGMS
jgi:hypothetical protein